MKIIYYIAYGSNLNLDNFLKRCPSAKILGKTFLQDMALVFKGDGEELAYLTLENNIGSTIPVGIFEITYFDSLRLDKFEGYPILYSKKWISLDLNGRTINALTYVMNPNFNYHLPSLNYFKSCLIGYDYFGFDRKFLIAAVKRTINYALHNDDKKSRN